MSTLMMRAVCAAAVVVLGTATFTGTAVAGTATAVGCSSTNTQSGNFLVFNWFGNFFNGKTVGSNCSHN